MNPVIAANWKMNLSLSETREFMAHLAKIIDQVSDSAELVIGPQIISFASTLAAWRDYKGDAQSDLKFAVQNCHWKNSGAFTGECSPLLAKEFGADFAIIGHSERRQYFGESNETAADRAKAALAAGLTPIFCIGEDLKTREADNTIAVLRAQCAAVFAVIKDAPDRFLFAYEPVWAIGTGKTATVEQAEAAHAFIRQFAAEHWGDQFCQKMPILYGGSVKPENAKELLASKNINGALVGGASLDPEAFVAIAAAVK